MKFETIILALAALGDTSLTSSERDTFCKVLGISTADLAAASRYAQDHMIDTIPEQWELLFEEFSEGH
jgi:hypothetical protein